MSKTTRPDSHKTCFSREDWVMFFDMIAHPEVPSSRMERARESYRLMVDPKPGESRPFRQSTNL